MPELLSLARFLVQRRTLDVLLVEIVERSARLLGTGHASIRILDAERKTLVATCRAGEPLHDTPQPFAMGEGLIGWVAQHETLLRLDEPENDPRFARRQGARVPFGAFLGVPLVAGGGCLGVLSFVAPTPGVFGPQHESLALLVAAITAPHLEVARLAGLTKLDPLTGLLNRRGYEAVLAMLGQGPISAVVADIDHFKSVNDRHGHDAGDAVLRRVAEVLAASVRRGDSVARAGGEEFVLLLSGASGELAQKIAERARERLSETQVDVGSALVRVTASFGVAEAHAGEPIEQVVHRADAAMYEAKRAGRNRVVRAS
jgi:diguanylate cyclase (GGDEF)-like protein